MLRDNPGSIIKIKALISITVTLSDQVIQALPECVCYILKMEGTLKRVLQKKRGSGIKTTYCISRIVHSLWSARKVVWIQAFWFDRTSAHVRRMRLFCLKKYELGKGGKGQREEA